MTPLEKVARAIKGKIQDERIVGVDALWDTVEVTDAQAMALARAAIEALREPTDEMLRVQLAVDYPATYRDHLRHPDNGLSSAKQNEVDIAKAKKRHDAMISQALSEEDR